jgi:transcriptional regulator with PAS, ATPase and Fis domain
LDLYYRLNVVRIDIPPLRERKDDIPPLIFYFLEKYSKEYKLSKNMSTEAMKCLCRYDWPGNVRELKNLIENLVIMVKNELILPEHLPDSINPNQKVNDGAVLVTSVVPMREAVEELEKQLINLALDESGSIRKAAKLLKVTHSTLLRKMK